MSRQFPPRIAYGLLALLTLLLLQSGCTPIQPVTSVQSPAVDTGLQPEPDNRVTTMEQFNSPNGEWRAISTVQTPRSGEEYYQRFVVEKTGSSQRYTLVDGNAPFGLGYTIMQPKAWSMDGSRLYYGNVPYGGGCALFLNASDLYELDLATGESREVLPPDSAWTLAVSPDTKQVAYHTRNQEESALYILDIASSEYARLDVASILGNDQLGEIVWSPASDAFAFVIAHDPCRGGWAASTSIYVVNTDNMTLTPYLQKDERLLMPSAWTIPEQPILAAWDPTLLGKGQEFVLDLTTNTITPIVITPPDPSELTIYESVSPNGEWIATTSIQFPDGQEDEYYQSLVVEHKSGSPSYTLAEDFFPYGLGYDLISVITWSAGGNRLYYGFGGGGDGCVLYSGTDSLFVFDTAIGQGHQILPPDTAWFISFAPDKQQIAYRSVNELVILEVNGGPRTAYNIEQLTGEDQLGQIVWSPDSSKFAFVIAHKPCSGEWAAATSIYMASYEAIVPLLLEDERLLIPIEWSSAQELRLATSDGTEEFILNLTDNSITPVPQ